ncbi:hypothetical protein F5X96DRAFT_637359 [Biscogniauxia mediterranea]|nr:hypothetical protein F5X96DRAFT_637359 [Biscogniauxia mediterranea]
MAQNTFDSELQSLSSEQLREVIQQMCTYNTRPDNGSVDMKDRDGPKDTKSVAIELIKTIKNGRPEPIKGREDAAQENPSSTVTPTSTTLVTEAPLSQNEESGSSSSVKQTSTPMNSRPHQFKTHDLTAEQVQNLVGMKDLEPVQRCGRCRNWYTESHNSDIACTYHRSRVHFREAELVAFVPTYAAWEHRYVPSSFRWACCGDQVGVSAGCVSTRHDPSAGPH